MTSIKKNLFSFLGSKSSRRIVLLIMAVLSPLILNAQAFFRETSQNELVMIIVMFMVFTVLVIVLIVIFYVLTILRTIIESEKKLKNETPSEVYFGTVNRKIKQRKMTKNRTLIARKKQYQNFNLI